MKIVNVCVAAVAVVAVAGCSEPAPAGPSPSAPAKAAVESAATAAGVRVGDAGSGCEMPLSFEVATGWKPAAIDVKALGELAALAKVGDFAVLCEIDAKPAGHIGFLRVYHAEGLSGRPREHLATFIEDGTRGQEISNATYRDLTLGAQQGAEVTWQSYDKGLDHHGKYSAFALNTRTGAVIVQLSPFGADEYPAMLPAFQLAGQSLTVAP